MRDKSAFTMVELVVVMVILCILFTVGMISLNGYDESKKKVETSTGVIFNFE